MDKGAEFSPCRTWRYRLWRTWDASRKPACFIGLNPSTADEDQDDPTIRRCIGYARSWGYGGLLMCNIFGFRSTDPAALKSCPDPIGPFTDAAIIGSCKEAGIVVCAWGVHGGLFGREGDVTRMLVQAGVLSHHLGITAGGHPKHPLYLPKDLEPRPWTLGHAAAA